MLGMCFSFLFFVFVIFSVIFRWVVSITHQAVVMYKQHHGYIFLQHAAGRGGV